MRSAMPRRRCFRRCECRARAYAAVPPVRGGAGAAARLGAVLVDRNHGQGRGWAAAHVLQWHQQQHRLGAAARRLLLRVRSRGAYARRRDDCLHVQRGGAAEAEGSAVGDTQRVYLEGQRAWKSHPGPRLLDGRRAGVDSARRQARAAQGAAPDPRPALRLVTALSSALTVPGGALRRHQGACHAVARRQDLPRQRGLLRVHAHRAI
mmetsp:Transcript_24868/g.74338  ORF Transcript_24868/g.74338 Transcript_24868/m.74338 type:complete len:207 (-) Transcript_24868:1388-2008(-)